MGCRIPIRQMPSGILFLKVSDLFGKSYGLPNSDSANAVRHSFFKGLRPFWQIGICQPIANSDSANAVRHSFLKVSDLFGKSYGLPNSDSANAVRHTFFKGLRPFWQIGICQPTIPQLHYLGLKLPCGLWLTTCCLVSSLMTL